MLAIILSDYVSPEEDISETLYFVSGEILYFEWVGYYILYTDLPQDKEVQRIALLFPDYYISRGDSKGELLI